MTVAEALPRKSRLAALFHHFAEVEDPRDARRILHPLPEALLLVVCGTIADCDDYEDIANRGVAHIDFLRRHPPYANGVPGERWLTILMNRINPALFADAFAAWVRESWPEKASLIAIDGKTSRRSHDRRDGAAPLHLVSAFATAARLALAAQAAPDKASERAAIPPLLDRLGAEDGLKGALVSIDAVAANAGIARAVDAQGADWLLAVKANQPTLRAEVEAAFAEAAEARDGGGLDAHAGLDKGHGRIEDRRTAVLRDTGWLEGDRRFPGEMRLPGAACLVRAETRVETKARPGSRRATSSPPEPSPPPTPPPRSAPTGRSRTGRTGCSTPDRRPGRGVAFADDQSRIRKGHGARNMATVRHFALNLVRAARDRRSIKSRRKLAGWGPDYPDAILASPPS